MKTYKATAEFLVIFLIGIAALTLPHSVYGAVTRVTNQKTGTAVAAASTTLAMPNNVTAGNKVVVVTSTYRSGASPPSNTVISKSSGTATIGTVTNSTRFSRYDGYYSSVLAVDVVPITGTGSLTLSVSATNAAGLGIAVNEYSGLGAVDGTPVSNTGDSTSESTGNISGHAGGLMITMSTETGPSTVSYTNLSDTLVYSNGDQSTRAFLCQDRLVGSDETHAITNTVTNSNWAEIGVAFRPSVSVRVSTSSDDAEECRLAGCTGGVGGMAINSSDLELAWDGGAQMVGMRFPNITIPQGATIDSAYVEFECDVGTWTGNVYLQIKGQDIDDAPTFTTATSNISSRTYTSATVSWDITAQYVVDSKYQTPDISTIVKEIVDRAGWSSGNDMVITVNQIGDTYSSLREMEAYDGETAAAPLLVVNYSTGKANGQACTTGGECTSGYCPTPDNVCCNAACNTQTCERCDGAYTATNGTCSWVNSGTADPDSNCGILDCDGGATKYYNGWSGNTCYFMLDVSANNAMCTGSSYACKTAADQCPSSTQGSACGTCPTRTTCKSTVNCTGTSAGTLGNIAAGSDFASGVGGDCDAIDCHTGGTKYYNGWASGTCYYKLDITDDLAVCDGAGVCKTAAVQCAASTQGVSTGVTATACQTQLNCTGTTAGSTGNVTADTDPNTGCASYGCTSKVYGWSGNDCKAATATSHDGMCNGSGACYTTFANSCTSGGSTLASCPSAGCKNASACVQDSASTTSDTVAEICYTSGQHGCDSGLECNATGSCVGAVCANIPPGGNHVVTSSCAFPETVNGVDEGTGTTNTAVLTIGTGDELILNPGFETIGDGGADVFANWMETAGDGAIARTMTAGEFRSGAAAAKLTGGVTHGATPKVNSTITVVPGSTYNLSFWTRGDGTNAGKYGVWDNTHSADIIALGTTGISGTTYTQVTTSFVAPAGCTSVAVTMNTPNSNGGIAYFDDVSLRINTSTPGYLTVLAGQTLAVGSIEMVNGSITIIKGTPGGTIKIKTPIYITDADGDGWGVNSTTQYFTGGTGKMRRNLYGGTPDTNDAARCADADTPQTPGGGIFGATCLKCASGFTANQTTSQDLFDQCPSYGCTSKVYGWSGMNCLAGAAGSGDAMCGPASTCGTFATSCTAGDALAICGSTNCVNASACVQDTASTTSDTVAEVCYTSAQHSCSTGYACNATGTCVSAGTTVCDSYVESNRDSSAYVGYSASGLIDAQSFTGDGGTLESAVFWGYRVGSPPGNVVANVYAHSGTFGTSSLPTGTALATSDAVVASSINTSPYALNTFTFSGGNKITLTNGTKYVLTVEAAGADASNYYKVGDDITSPTHAGNFSQYKASSWNINNTIDLIFYVYTSGSPVVCDSYNESNEDTTTSIGEGGSTRNRVAQSFTGNGGVLDSAKFFMYKVGSPPGNVVAKVYAHTGTFGTSSVPTGSALATSDTVAASNISAYPAALNTFTFSGANNITLTNGTKYVVTVEYSGGDASNYLELADDSTSSTHGGNYSEYISSWTAVSSLDLIFYVYTR